MSNDPWRRFAAEGCYPKMSDEEPADDMDIPDEVRMPITEQLDLHSFRPRDLPELLPEYFAECRKIGLLAVRVVHGKGTGALREGVHRLLEKMPEVASWTWPASQPSGGWGATWVYLKPLSE